MSYRIHLDDRVIVVGAGAVNGRLEGRIYYEDIVAWAGLDPARDYRVMFNWRTPEPYCPGGFIKRGEYVDLVDDNLWFNVKGT